MSLRGGRWYVPSTLTDAFYAAYEAALASGESLHIAEQHRHIGPIAIDLDFRGRAPSMEADADTAAATVAKQYTVSQVEGFVRSVYGALRHLVDLEAGTECYVLEKAARLKDGTTVKDGLHLMLPGVVGRAELQHLLRADLLRTVARMFAEQGAPESVYDEAVIEKAGWLMYGSRKPEESAANAWKVTRVFAYDPEATGEGVQEVTASTDLSPGRLVRLLGTSGWASLPRATRRLGC